MYFTHAEIIMLWEVGGGGIIMLLRLLVLCCFILLDYDIANLVCHLSTRYNDCMIHLYEVVSK